MTVPLILLATGTVLLSLVGTPIWPWFHAYMTGHLGELTATPLHGSIAAVMLLSLVVVAGGVGLGWRLYGRTPPAKAEAPDPLEQLEPDVFGLLRAKYFVDELYDATVVRLTWLSARASDWLDRFVWNGLVRAVAYLVLGLSWLDRLVDEFVVNLGFDKGCGSLRTGGRLLSLWQNGQVQRYLRALGLGLAILVLIFIWGCRR